MLNYIWLSLISIGIILALTFDISKEFDDNPIFNNTFEGKVFEIEKENKLVFSDSALIDFLNTDYLLLNKKEIEPNRILSLNIYNKIQNKKTSPDKINIKIVSLSPSNGSKRFVKFLVLKEHFPKMKAVTDATLNYAKTSVDIALGLIGIMAFWLGIMKIAENSGLVNKIAKFSKPIMKKLFPEIPEEHPALTAMLMNISANMLGLGNAATPFGLKAMEELDKLNPEKGTATNSMCTFLAINTAGLTLIPATAIAIRAAQGSSDPTIIIGTSFFGSLIATFTGISVAKAFEFFSKKNKTENRMNMKNIFKIISFVFIFILFAIPFIKVLFLSSFSSQLINGIKAISVLAIPLIIITFLSFGVKEKINLYASFTEGAKEGFEIAVKIIPYLVAMLVAIGIFRASGGMEILVSLIAPFTNLIGMPAEVLPMALMRPLSGSASIGIMTELMKSHGPDSFIGVLASTILGSTETTFYVLALYFGSVNIKKTRHSVIAGVSADVAGILAALFIVKLLFIK